MFSPDRTKASGLSVYCKPCQARRSRERYARNLDAIRERNREAARKRSQRGVRAYDAGRVALDYWLARREALDVYGSGCEHCGSDERARLEFDHVDGGGAGHRLVEGTKTMIMRIATTGARLDYVDLQLLCTSCHRAKTSAEARVG